MLNVPSTPEELLFWAVLLVVGTVVTKHINQRLETRRDRRETRRQWYEDILALAARIERRFFTEYWQPRDDPNLQAVGEALAPLAEDLGEKLDEAPDGADSTVHFARTLHDRCVELKYDPEMIRNRQYGVQDHMRGPDVIIHRAKLTQRQAENDLKHI